MKQVTGNLSYSTGAHNGGICIVQIAPKEWFTAPFQINYITQKIVAVPAFIFGKSWLDLQLIDNTFQFAEKPKQSARGEYFDTTLTGQLNNLVPASRQILNTLRNHQHIVKITDLNKQVRIIGNTDKACSFSFTYSNDNTKSGTEEISISLALQCPDPAAYL